MVQSRFAVRFGKFSPANGPPILYDVHMDEHTEWLPQPGSICMMVGVSVRDKNRHTTLKLGPLFAVNVLNLPFDYLDTNGTPRVSTMDRHWEGVLFAVYVPMLQ